MGILEDIQIGPRAPGPYSDYVFFCLYNLCLTVHYIQGLVVPRLMMLIVNKTLILCVEKISRSFAKFFSGKFMSILDFVCAWKLNKTLPNDIKLMTYWA